MGSASIGLTGSPCTGKKTIAPLVAASLGFSVVGLNEVAARLVPRSEAGELEVDVRRLRSALKPIPTRTIFSGHLLPSVFREGEIQFVAVLRCEPMTLRKRLIARGYSHEKVVENLEAELIGVVLDEAVRAFGPERVHEYDTTSVKPLTAAKRIVADYTAGSRQTRPSIDWTRGYDSTRLRSLLSPVRTEPAST